MDEDMKGETISAKYNECPEIQQHIYVINSQNLLHAYLQSKLHTDKETLCAINASFQGLLFKQRQHNVSDRLSASKTLFPQQRMKTYEKQFAAPETSQIVVVKSP